MKCYSIVCFICVLSIFGYGLQKKELFSLNYYTWGKKVAVETKTIIITSPMPKINDNKPEMIQTAIETTLRLAHYTILRGKKDLGSCTWRDLSDGDTIMTYDIKLQQSYIKKYKS